MVDGPAELFAAADMIMKVKEPLPAEWPLLRAARSSSLIFISRPIAS